MTRLVMLVHEENGRFGASFPDLPGCTTVARDLDALILKAPEVVAFHIAGLAEDGQTTPAFRSLAALRADPLFREDAVGAIVVLLDHEPPGRTVRVNISLDEAVLRRIDRAADEAGESRSSYLARAAQARLMSA